MDYNANVTLNEKDSLQDLLNMEKSVVKMYSTAITEGCSNGFRTLVKSNLNQAIDDQVEVFFMMTENGYYQVESAPQQKTSELRANFTKVKESL